MPGLKNERWTGWSSRSLEEGPRCPRCRKPSLLANGPLCCEYDYICHHCSVGFWSADSDYFEHIVIRIERDPLRYDTKG